MKKKIKMTSQEIEYIPIRYIIAIIITVLEILMIIGIVTSLAYYIPYFYLAIYITVIGVIVSIVGSHDNPDYKVPWILVILLLPIVGFMFYFLFYKRKLTKKFVKKFQKIEESLDFNDKENLEKLKNENLLVYTHTLQLTNISSSHLYQNTYIQYFDIGEKMYKSMLEELKKAEKFIFLEYFIIEEGKMWNDILDILKEKAFEGIEVKVIYDDIGCMRTLSGNYYKTLKKYHIDCIPFSKLRGQADSEFNNRNHRKILVIDGKVAFTGGINIADEYINVKEKFGHWKDTGIKLVGEAVKEFTKIFLLDFEINSKDKIFLQDYYVDFSVKNDSYIIPFGDGPRPIYEKNVSKIVIMNMLNTAAKYVYITTPYLIIDNELMNAIENASTRGVDVRIIVPHIPDKKLIFKISKFNCQKLMKSNVKIYEYEKGFIHSKTYLVDDKIALVGTINLDYRSLTHHFENGVWIYNDLCLKDIKEDFITTLDKSIYMNEKVIVNKFLDKVIVSVLNFFAPLL